MSCTTGSTAAPRRRRPPRLRRTPRPRLVLRVLVLAIVARQQFHVEAFERVRGDSRAERLDVGLASVQRRMNVAALSRSPSTLARLFASASESPRDASRSLPLVRRVSSSQSTPTSCDAANGTAAPAGNVRCFDSREPGGAVVTASARRLAQCETLNRIGGGGARDDDAGGGGFLLLRRRRRAVRIVGSTATSAGLPCSPYANLRLAGATSSPQYLARTHRVRALDWIAWRLAASVIGAPSRSAAASSGARHRRS